MIARFRKTSRLAALATSALLSVVCWLAFTRAAAPTQAEPATTAPPGDQRPLDSVKPRDRAEEINRLRKRMNQLESEIAVAQDKVDQLRILSLSNNGNESLDTDTIRMIERERVNHHAAAARSETLLKELRSKTGPQLAQAIPTAIPDVELVQLIRDLNSAETQYSKLTQEFGPESSSVRQVDVVRATVTKQIDARVEGILAGLQAQVAANMASAASLSNLVQTAKIKDAKLNERIRPYLMAKRDLEMMERLREALLLKLWTAEFEIGDNDLP